MSSFKYYVRECNNEIRNLTDTKCSGTNYTRFWWCHIHWESRKGSLFPFLMQLISSWCNCIPLFVLESIYISSSGRGWINPSNLELISLIFRGQEQWAQCDSCSKWRRLPVDILIPPKWTCADNAWDQNR